MADTIFEKTCRTCNSESHDLRNIFHTRMIFGEESSPLLVYKAINKLGFLEKPIREDDDLPKYICNACCERLMITYNFKRLINESQSEFDVALKYEKRRRGNQNIMPKAREQPKIATIVQYSYDIKFDNDTTFYLNGDDDNIEVIDMPESDEELEKENEEEKENEYVYELEEEVAVKAKRNEESPKQCVVCNRTYKSLEALRFHQTAMHRGISILQE